MKLQEILSDCQLQTLSTLVDNASLQMTSNELSVSCSSCEGSVALHTFLKTAHTILQQHEHSDYQKQELAKNIYKKIEDQYAKIEKDPSLSSYLSEQDKKTHELIHECFLKFTSEQPWNLLPSELKCEIFKHVQPLDLNTCTTVSQKWQTVIMNNEETQNIAICHKLIQYIENLLHNSQRYIASVLVTAIGLEFAKRNKIEIATDFVLHFYYNLNDERLVQRIISNLSGLKKPDTALAFYNKLNTKLIGEENRHLVTDSAYKQMLLYDIAKGFLEIHCIDEAKEIISKMETDTETDELYFTLTEMYLNDSCYAAAS